MDLANKRWIFNEGFCRTVLNKHSAIVKFLNVIFIEYTDFLLQYVSCYSTDAKAFSFPYQNFLTKYKRRIPMIKKCYENLDTEDFMKYCWFICSTHKVMNISDFYDGDRALYKRIYLAIFSFLRKFNVDMKDANIDITSLGNVNGLIMEPVSPQNTITKRTYMDD